MYRNICFDYQTNEIILWTWTASEGRTKQVYPHKPYLYVDAADGKDGVSLFNTPLQKVEFKSNKNRKEFAESVGKTYYNLSPERQFLVNHFLGQNKSDDFSVYPLKIFYLDIEVDARNGFPDPRKAKDPINLITVYDTEIGCYHTFGLNKPYYTHEDNVIYKYYQTEEELVKAFLRFWRKNFPDIVTGWNTEGFDIPYLCNRINYIYGDEEACNRLSPVGRCWKQDNVTKRHGAHQDQYDQVWYISGITHIDFQGAYKTFTRETRESYSLNHIAEVELDSGKLHYNAVNLTELADTNWYSFVDYNIQDVRLVLRLEEKLNYLATCRKLAYLALCPLGDSMGTTNIVTGVAAQKALEQKKIIPTFTPSHAGEFDGGYVREPQKGLQKSLLYYDADSLYPNTLVTLNISPETKIGRVETLENGTKRVTTTKGKVYDLTPENFNDFVTRSELSVSSANVLFTQKQRGIFSQIIEEIYAERVAIKDQLKILKKKIAAMTESSPDYAKIKYQIDNLDLKQYTIKIFLNRIYGYFGEPHSPMYDLDIASSVTLTGQSCIKEASELCNKYLKETYKIDYDAVIMNDTDSVVLSVEPILKSLNEPFDKGGVINPIVYDIGTKLKVVLDTGIAKFAKDVLRSNHCTYKFKQENISEIGLFIKKKHYILNIRDKEGILCDEFKYSGIQVVKTSTPKKVKPMIKRVIERTLKKGDRKEVENILKEAYEEYQTYSIEDIAIPTSLNDYNKYKNKSNGFDIGLHTPWHVKGAIYHNLLIDKFELGNKYEKLKGGSKIKALYLVPNPHNLSVICFLQRYPDEFKENYKPDYKKMFEKSVVNTVTRVFDAINWSIKTPTMMEANDLLELFS